MIEVKGLVVLHLPHYLSISVLTYCRSNILPITKL